ncbi:uncharacterized protein K452DRAFT_314311 [Aplosporella prunicola CBS 121167]|uniref:Uncharacterized protein n=1 Tax=Aplosporella prunicola CBS 121167 TaxID=1176127 RepID=A0A6A6BSK0_9PEZI|nr:uncharacterized protein K452DRAFT_314311 [Aplosporella prunicola CBS 121167]KAF2147079.1 hypothetical protein K452DRAFT_314311 [Aplosporella prunicola CBS 121167]
MAGKSFSKGLGLLLLFLFSFLLAQSHGHPTSGVSNELEKRTLDPPLPDVKLARTHLKKPGPGKSIFWSAGAIGAASDYAAKNKHVMLGECDDGSGWANFEGGPFEEYVNNFCDDKPTWTDDEMVQAKGHISQAYAENAEGEVIVILPKKINAAELKTSIWERYELPALKKNTAVTKISVFDVDNVNEAPTGKPNREISKSS